MLYAIAMGQIKTDFTSDDCSDFVSCFQSFLVLGMSGIMHLASRRCLYVFCLTFMYVIY